MATTTTAAPSGSKLKKVATLGTLAMAIMIVTNIYSMRGLASQAEYGYTSIFYYVLAALIFLLPYSLVCAELASTYSKSGGVFRWCSEAFGPRWGWAAMYYDWQMAVIWFPAVLMFGAVSLAYIFWPETFDAKLSKNIIYTLIVVLAVYWFSTFNTFKGTSASNKLSVLGGLFGTIIPTAILIILGVVYLCTGGVNHIDAHQSFWPDFSKFGTVVLAGSIFLFYAGMEMQAVHVPQMKDPARSFPKAVLISFITLLAVFIFGTLAIGFVVPKKDINLLASLLVAFNDLWAHLHCEWLGNVMAVLITFGVIGQVSVVIAGPSKGILDVGKAGFLPRSLQKTNRNGIQTSILWIQGIFVTVLALALIVLPSVESAYQILSQMSTVIYLVMVLIIYFSFLRLRRTEPNAKRGFRVPGGNFGKWFTALLGIAGALLAMFISFVPPSQINTGSPVIYVLIVLLGSAFFIAVPFVVYACRKPWWHDKGVHFFPFDWQIEGRKPGEISKWPKGYVPTQKEIDDAINGDIEQILSPAQSVQEMAKAVKIAEEASDKAAQAAQEASDAARAAETAAQISENSVMQAVDADKDTPAKTDKD